MHITFTAFILGWYVSLKHVASAAYDIGFDDDNDLTSFVTRPDIRAPLFNVDIHQRDHMSSGYWFIAPYANVRQEALARKYYQPCQTGPTIYDNNGDLVWTGACQFKNQNAFDFKLVKDGDSHLLSTILMSGDENEKGQGLLMDSSYSIVTNVSAPKLISNFNMHEFSLANDGKSALYIVYRPEYVELDEELDHDGETGWIANMGFREVDVKTGEALFEWWAFPEVRPQESKVVISGIEGPHPNSWNWFHMNSVEKNSAGDYIVSSRYTDTIFKISGKTGKLEWRLEGSGKTSDFVLQDFNFSRQHDARWIEHSNEREVISFLDNASDLSNQTSDYSSVLIVELDKTARPWTAKVIKRWIRPDSSLSRLRGNAQFLGNGNLFTCWSDNSFLSEHSPDGELLMNATFRSTRFVTYRGYKFEFSGTPQEAPMIKALVNGATRESSTTTIYVSWNGATEVASWKFYGTSQEMDDVLLGTKRRTGFETSFHSNGYTHLLYAEAIAQDGSVLGRTATFAAAPADHWPQAVEASADQLPGDGPAPVIANGSLEWTGRRVRNSGAVGSGGCSTYGSGCGPAVQQRPLGIVPVAKSEL